MPIRDPHRGFDYRRTFPRTQIFATFERAAALKTQEVSYANAVASVTLAAMRCNGCAERNLVVVSGSDFLGRCAEQLD